MALEAQGGVGVIRLAGVTRNLKFATLTAESIKTAPRRTNLKGELEAASASALCPFVPVDSESQSTSESYRALAEAAAQAVTPAY